MSFAYWPVLYLLFIPASVLVWVWLRPSRRLVLPFDGGRKRSGWVWKFLINCFQSMPAIMLAIAIIFLAGPRHLGVPKTKRTMTNIEFCLDVSGSMASPFGSGSRHDAAMAAINDFIDYREGDAFGLTIFGDRATSWVPLTNDATAFKYATPFLRPEKLPRGFGGGTMIGLGLRHCLGVLNEREEGDRMIILVSDGASFDLNAGQDEIVARELRDNNVVVYGVHISPTAVPPEVAAIATITGGETFNAGDPEGLKSVFRRIDSMQQAKLESTYSEVLDFFFPFAIACLVALGSYFLSLWGLRYTPW